MNEAFLPKCWTTLLVDLTFNLSQWEGSKSSGVAQLLQVLQPNTAADAEERIVLLICGS